MIKEGKIRFATLVGNILKRYDTVRHIEKLMYLSSTAATFPLISIFKMLFNVGSPVSMYIVQWTQSTLTVHATDGQQWAFPFYKPGERSIQKFCIETHNETGELAIQVTLEPASFRRNLVIPRTRSVCCYNIHFFIISNQLD